MSKPITLYGHAGVSQITSESFVRLLTVILGPQPLEGRHHPGRTWPQVRAQNDGFRRLEERSLRVHQPQWPRAIHRRPQHRHHCLRGETSIPP